ncbi:hypothetical protein B0H14DRAFT_2576624 [Mycena olivaceomarginata]|nr:hypothetical protein B0H14DRAFT_2576624 [Mycena olivaceomarginata]
MNYSRTIPVVPVHEASYDIAYPHLYATLFKKEQFEMMRYSWRPENAGLDASKTLPEGNSPTLLHSHQLFPNGNQPEIQRDAVRKLETSCRKLEEWIEECKIAPASAILTMPHGVLTKEKPIVTGPSHELINRIEKLGTLLRNLLDSIPLVMASSISSYNFAMDPKRLEENGLLSALGHSLEIAFKTWKLGTVEVPIRERGPGLEALEGICKRAVRDMSPGDHAVFQDAWIERLIKAALDSGAKIPQKKQKAVEEAPPAAPAAPKKTCIETGSPTTDMPSNTSVFPAHSVTVTAGRN